MGGAREYQTPAKSQSGQVIGQLRIHENNGEVHFHDDTQGLKSAVPVATIFAAWEAMSAGRQKKFDFDDTKNGTRLNMRIKRGKSGLDLRMNIVALPAAKFAKGTEFSQFDSFIRGK